MNIYSGSSKPEERILSNFASTPFSININGEVYNCGSVEGFWQGLKCKGDMRLHVFTLGGMAAKQYGSGKKVRTFKLAGITYKYGSEDHKSLIKEAIKQKILQNHKAAKALQESTGTITHNVPGSSKPVIKMEKLLMQIRVELFGH
jgi:hypothetical protein